MKMPEKEETERFVAKRAHIVMFAGLAMWLGAVLKFRGFDLVGAVSLIVGIVAIIFVLKSLNDAFAEPVYR